MKDTIAPLAEQRGTVPTWDPSRRIVGVLTAGDLTRLMEHDENLLGRPVVELRTAPRAGAGRPPRRCFEPPRRLCTLRRCGRVVRGVAAVLLAACDQSVSTPLAGGELQQMQADQVVFAMQSYITTSGVREGSIRADTAYVFQDSAVVDLRGMEVTFYDEEGRARATVNGRVGEWNQDTDRMVARGDVVLLVHQDGSRIESEEIHYDPTNDRIWSDSATTRTDAQGAVTRGSAFESDLDFADLRILNVRGGGRVF